MNILIIEDEKELATGISHYLQSESYSCEFAYTYQEAMNKIVSFDYDCILLDIMLPGGSGMDILDELKKMNKQDGIIIISAKGSLEDKVKGLQTGADDYLAKPFHLPELGARIHSVIRRKQFDNSNIIQFNELKIDLPGHTVSVNGVPLLLTKKEFDLLLYLLGNKNKVVSKTSLAEHLSGEMADMLDSHDFIYAHIKNLKKKLAESGSKDYIKTLYGVGYKWEE